MNTTSLTNLVTLLIALSIASERLVEIVKGLWPWLNSEDKDPRWEGFRKATLQVMAVAAGVLTAYLAKDALPAMEFLEQKTQWIALGLLASGGSGFWNSILTYLTKVKDIKGAQAQQAKVETKVLVARIASQGLNKA